MARDFDNRRPSPVSAYIVSRSVGVLAEVPERLRGHVALQRRKAEEPASIAAQHELHEPIAQPAHAVVKEDGRTPTEDNVAINPPYATMPSVRAFLR